MDKARIVIDPSRLKGEQKRDIFVCDSIDPNITYIVLLVGWNVERREGC